MARIDDLKASMAGFKKQIDNPGTSAQMKILMEKSLAKAGEELATLEKEEKPAAEKKEEKAAEKPAAEKKEKKKSAKKAPAKKKEEEEEPEFRTVNGVKYNMAICEEVLASAKARKERDEKTQKKSKSATPAEKAAKAIESATEKVVAVVPEKTIEDAPQKVIAALEKFEKDSEKAVMDFCKEVGVSKALTDKLAHAYETVIAPIVKEIEEEIKAAKEKK